MVYTQKELENIRKAQCLGLANDIIIAATKAGLANPEKVIEDMITTAEEIHKQLKEKKYFTD